MDTNNQTAGGGEILDLIGNDVGSMVEYIMMNNPLIGQYRMASIVVLIIAALLLVGMCYMILKTMKISSLSRGRGIDNELDHMAQVHKRDAKILRANKFILGVTEFVEKTPFAVASYRKDYLNYLLDRANIRTPGNLRMMKAEEYNALLKFVQSIGIVVGVIVALLVSPVLGFLLLVFIVGIGSVVPMMYIKGIVAEKDLEIEANFADFYLMIHYVLLSGSKTALVNIMKSYDKTTSSEEMHRFIDVCVESFETYGEYEGPERVKDRFKEIPVVTKLMRLIRQTNDGANVEAELMGFRKELLEAKEYAIELRGKKLVARANASFNVLTIVLIQAILSAMMIYLDDLSISAGFF